MKRINPATSHEAYKQLHPNQVKRHYEKIIKALEVLGSATADKISEHLNMEHVQVTRRLSEMERNGIIFKPGLKMLTRKGRSAFVWSLCNREVPVHTQAERIIERTNSLPIQNKLFE